MIDALQSATGGMVAAQARFTEAAVQVARMRAGPSGTGQPIGTHLPAAAQIDLSQTARDLVASRAEFAANAAVARAADGATRRLLDVRA
ncbi:flagellar protein [Methylobacterium radiodurans]|uniref:Flagellar protein n=1 Tax=Methylobacterium radiodurans TaxID=2202828 RepID=A0A2U8VSG0_9HYPH|nr:flagellar protein [Methylobacterium radiodurans]AWN36673.1 flagellar protein [Methylobacterium radiodurans]